MKIFIDSADIDEIREVYIMGIVDGITTNPSLIKKASLKHNQNIRDYILNILAVAGKDPVSLEIIGKKEDEIVYQANKLIEKFGKYGNVVIKVPINSSYELKSDYDALKSIKKLSNNGISVNATLIMTPEQALLAAKAGAKYVSPFVGRIDDYLKNMHPNPDEKEEYYPREGIVHNNRIIHDNGIVSGIHLIEEIKKIFSNYNLNTKIIAASIRNIRQVREIAKIGSDIATLPFYIIEKMLIHHKTSEGVKKFIDDTTEEYKDILK